MGLRRRHRPRRSERAGLDSRPRHRRRRSGAPPSFSPASGKLTALGVGSFGPIDIGGGDDHDDTETGLGRHRSRRGAAHRARAFPSPSTPTSTRPRSASNAGGRRIGLDTFCYLTVGTGIGGGVLAGNAIVHGLVHPEIGHMRIPHDRASRSVSRRLPVPRRLLRGPGLGHGDRRPLGRARRRARRPAGRVGAGGGVPGARDRECRVHRLARARDPRRRGREAADAAAARP